MNSHISEVSREGGKPSGGNNLHNAACRVNCNAPFVTFWGIKRPPAAEATEGTLMKQRDSMLQFTLCQ